MELGEPDGSGRRRPVVVKDSEFDFEVGSLRFFPDQIDKTARLMSGFFFGDTMNETPPQP